MAVTVLFLGALTVSIPSTVGASGAEFDEVVAHRFSLTPYDFSRIHMQIPGGDYLFSYAHQNGTFRTAKIYLEGKMLEEFELSRGGSLRKSAPADGEYVFELEGQGRFGVLSPALIDRSGQKIVKLESPWGYAGYLIEENTPKTCVSTRTEGIASFEMLYLDELDHIESGNASGYISREVDTTWSPLIFLLTELEPAPLEVLVTEGPCPQGPPIGEDSSSLGMGTAFALCLAGLLLARRKPTS